MQETIVTLSIFRCLRSGASKVRPTTLHQGHSISERARSALRIGRRAGQAGLSARLPGSHNVDDCGPEGLRKSPSRVRAPTDSICQEFRLSRFAAGAARICDGIVRLAVVMQNRFASPPERHMASAASVRGFAPLRPPFPSVVGSLGNARTERV